MLYTSDWTVRSCMLAPTLCLMKMHWTIFTTFVFAFLLKTYSSLKSQATCPPFLMWLVLSADIWNAMFQCHTSNFLLCLCRGVWGCARPLYICMRMRAHAIREAGSEQRPHRVYELMTVKVFLDSPAAEIQLLRAVPYTEPISANRSFIHHEKCLWGCLHNVLELNSIRHFARNSVKADQSSQPLTGLVAVYRYIMFGIDISPQHSGIQSALCEHQDWRVLFTLGVGVRVGVGGVSPPLDHTVPTEAAGVKRTRRTSPVQSDALCNSASLYVTHEP